MVLLKRIMHSRKHIANGLLLVVMLMIVGCCLWPHSSYAQDQPNGQEEVWRDEQWQEIQERVEFGKKKEKDAEEKEENTSDLNRDEGHVPANETLTKGIGYAMLALFVVVLLYLLFQIKFAPRDRKVQVRLEELVDHQVEDNIEADFDRLLDQAVRTGKFRFGIRLLFLDTLKWLNENQKIVWKKYKTNGQYVHELSSQSGLDAFKQLVWVYELIWFGHRDIDEAEFMRFKLLFDQFKTMKDE